MNWDAIGATAELLGAVGVIASLVYLATQIRQSRDQIRTATYQQIFENLEAVSRRGFGDLAWLFDPCVAITSSIIEPLPHQISAIYEEMLPRQPMRFLPPLPLSGGGE